ncbi:MAG: hypothetical protein EZS28_019338 [Streblomastix strix]|uniref:Uncharacterized protein n=1 Tax=Streblomastix strix TaxID=222440 RepID=A0A5J4VR28_9EUKA|nr:MAG: hypothetical protein EZS28_019338 [Streblomastix strix]
MKGNVDQLSFQGVRAKKGEKTASGSQIGGAEAIGLSKSQKKHQKSAKKIIVPGKKTKKEKKVKREKKEKKFEKKEKKIHANKPRK